MATSIKNNPIVQLFQNRLGDAENRYLQTKQRFLEEAVTDPSTAVALGEAVVQRQSHFESLKNAEKYLTGGDYPSPLAAVEAALDYFRFVLVREASQSRSSCDFHNGVELARRKGIKDTVQALEYFVQNGSEAAQ